jgi:hypothetical protein
LILDRHLLRFAALLPTSLAATATSERHQDQNREKSEHVTPRLGWGSFPSASASFARRLRAADGMALEQPPCHLHD